MFDNILSQSIAHSENMNMQLFTWKKGSYVLRFLGLGDHLVLGTSETLGGPVRVDILREGWSPVKLRMSRTQI